MTARRGPRAARPRRAPFLARAIRRLARSLAGRLPRAHEIVPANDPEA